MKCQILFSGKNKKNYFKISENFTRVLSIKGKEGNYLSMYIISCTCEVVFVLFWLVWIEFDNIHFLISFYLGVSLNVQILKPYHTCPKILLSSFHYKNVLIFF